MTTTTGSWTGTPPITFTYQWVRCDATGANCAAIASAIAQTYTLASADVGHELYARVTATNSGGAATIRTYLSRVVAPAAQVNTNLGSALPAALPPSSGATFYVSTAGLDSNTGTLTAPWRTIQHALDTLQSGQTALVRTGTYGEDLYFSRAGTSSAPITIRRYPGEHPVLHAASTTGNTYPIQISGSYFRLSGFIIENSLGISSTNVYIENSASYIELSGTRFGTDRTRLSSASGRRAISSSPGTSSTTTAGIISPASINRTVCVSRAPTT